MSRSSQRWLHASGAELSEASLDAVAIAKQFREKRLNRMGVTEEMLHSDWHVLELEIVGDMSPATDAEEINVAIRASDRKYSHLTKES